MDVNVVLIKPKVLLAYILASAHLDVAFGDQCTITPSAVCNIFGSDTHLLPSLFWPKRTTIQRCLCCQ